MPRQLQDRHLLDRHPGPRTDRLEGSVYIGEPKPGDQYRLFLIASGFGMNVKLVGSFKPNPETGQLTADFENLPQVPFEDFQLHLFSGERGLMATPIACTIYTIKAEFYPLGRIACPNRNRARSSASTPAPTAAECPGQIRPFNPTLEAGTSNSDRRRLLAPSP